MSDNRRSGSEKRRTVAPRCGRFTPEDDAAIQQRMDALGCSFAAMVRHDSLGKQLPPRRQPKMNAGLFGKALSRLAALTAELGKEGSNLNQLTHYVNAGRPVTTLENALVTSLHRVDELHREVLELRALFMQAVGAERLPRDEKEP
jgi:lambda repressor-like predicted transcriptional regulator